MIKNNIWGLIIAGIALLIALSVSVLDDPLGISNLIFRNKPFFPFSDGLKYMDEGKYDLAINKFNQALKSQEDKRERAEIYSYIAECELGLQNKTGAIEYYSKAIEAANAYEEQFFMRHFYKETHLKLGLLRFDAKDYQGALEEFNKSIEHGPYERETYFIRGKTKAILQDYQGAVDDYTVALSYGIEHPPEYYEERALAYEKLDEKEKARADREKAKELTGKDPQ